MTTTTRPAHATAWRNAVFATFALNGLGAATWVIRLPSIQEHLELSVSQVGYLIFGVSAGSIVGLLLASHVIQWLGGRRSDPAPHARAAPCRLVAIGVGTSALSSYAVVFAGMALYGFSSAIWDVAMNVEGAAVEKVIGRTLMPLFHASWSAGMVVGTGIGTVAVYAGVDTLVHTVVIAVLLAIGAVIVPTRAAGGLHARRHRRAGRARRLPRPDVDLARAANPAHRPDRARLRLHRGLGRRLAADRPDRGPRRRPRHGRAVLHGVQRVDDDRPDRRRVR